MSVPDIWQPFRIEMREAVVANLGSLPVRHASLLASVAHLSIPDACRRAASWMHSQGRYAFDRRLPVCAVDVCLRRGFTACGDVASLVAAVAISRRARQVDALVRTAPTVPGYAHVVVIVDGVEVDPYAFRALPEVVSAPAARWSLLEDAGQV